MVRVQKRFCIDRYEAMLVDEPSGERLSPYYSPTRKRALAAVKHWQKERKSIGSPEARAIGLPQLPLWQRERDAVPMAVSRQGVLPNGHVSGAEAETACQNAGKRLCTLEEWRLACGGEQGWDFPWGESFEHRKCNVFREAHPAGILHDNPSVGHTDPRLNAVKHKGKPLLRKTGATPSCRSVWEDDAVYDMVGNLDEWIDDPEGTFAGGFYARATKKGCDAAVTGHVYSYADYSTGVRCCADLPR